MRATSSPHPRQPEENRQSCRSAGGMVGGRSPHVHDGARQASPCAHPVAIQAVYRPRPGRSSRTAHGLPAHRATWSVTCPSPRPCPAAAPCKPSPARPCCRWRLPSSTARPWRTPSAGRGTTTASAGRRGSAPAAPSATSSTAWRPPRWPTRPRWPPRTSRPPSPARCGRTTPRRSRWATRPSSSPAPRCPGPVVARSSPAATTTSTTSRSTTRPRPRAVSSSPTAPTACR